MSGLPELPAVGGPLDGERLPDTGREHFVRVWPKLTEMLASPMSEAPQPNDAMSHTIERYRSVFACNRTMTRYGPSDRCVQAYAHESLSDGEAERIVRERHL